MDDGEDNEVGVLAMHSLIHGSIITVLLHRHLWQCMTVSNVAAYYSCGLWRGRPNATAAPMRRDTVAGPLLEQNCRWSSTITGAASRQERHWRRSGIAAGAASAREQHRRRSSIDAGAVSPPKRRHHRSNLAAEAALTQEQQ